MAMTSDANRKRLFSKSSLPMVCKLIELCLSIIIVGLIVDPTNNGILAFDQNHSGIVYVAWPGYIIINTILLISHGIGDRVPKRTLALFAFVGGILFVAAASVVIHDWNNNRRSIIHHPPKLYQDQAIAAGVIGMFAAAFFFAEIYFLVVSDDEE